MRLPISWLGDWIEIDATPEHVAAALTSRGFYVEGIERHGQTYPGVVVARVLDVARHPNADKLSLCRVDGGEGELRVVCGAPNVYAGMLAPLATVGAELPGGITIRASKIRGEQSQGMLCSARELQVSEDHEGILDLAKFIPDAANVPLGTPIDRLMPPPDAVLEIEIPFNRPDGLGVVGLAREVRAALGGRWTPAATERLGRRFSGGSEFDLELDDPEGCPRYIAQAVDNVTVGASPDWVARRLEAMGQRPVNNVVDATNLVLFELGQPVHAFDLDRLRGPAIRVRRARPDETLTTLDDKPRKLDPEVLVIADRDTAVALAGIMGGAESEVSGATTRLLLESAWFDPRRVRRGSRRLGLSTEASKRFERGVDPEMGSVAVARFLELLQQMIPDARPGAGRERVAERIEARRMPLRMARYRRVVGVDVASDEAATQLEAIGFAVARGEPLAVTVPSWRPDVVVEDDLVEEVARSIGYDAIPERPFETAGVHAVPTPERRLLDDARRAMLARGLHEAWCSTLVSEREGQLTSELLGGRADALVRLENPMSRENEVLRPNLVAGLLRACAFNVRQGAAAVRLFEVGTAFTPGERLPVETLMVTAIVTGPAYAHAHSGGAITAGDSSLAAIDFDGAKGLWQVWLEELRVDSPEWRPYAGPGWKPGASAEVASRASRIGWAGTLGPSYLREWGIETPVQVFVALLEPILQAVRRPSVVLPGKYPPVRRDLAFFVPESVTHLVLERAIVRAAGERLVSIELFDVYSGPGTPSGTKSMAYALQFQHPERTMTESEVQAIQERIAAAVGKDLGGRLRER